MTPPLVDLTILAAWIAVAVGIGLWSGRRAKSADEYSVGGRDLPAWALFGSIVATETSTVTFLSVPGLAYRGDLTFLQLPLGYLVGRALVCAFLLPAYFEGRLMSAYEVLEQRFGGGTRKLASLVFVAARTLGDGLRLYLGAIVLAKLLDLELWQAVLALGAVTVLFTFVGGLRAVVWTDVLALVVYVGGAIAALWLLTREAGGVDAVLDLAAAQDKLRVFDFSFDPTVPYQFWAALIGGAALSFGTHGVDQMFVQRYLAARSRRAAQGALIASGVFVLFQFALFLVLGIALYAWAQLGSPPIELARDEELATYVAQHLPTGLRGVVLGSIFAAAMSTLSSSLNSSATALATDLLFPRVKPTSDAAKVRWIRWLTVGFGLAQIVVALSGPAFDASVVSSALAIAGFATGLLLGLFLLGQSRRGLSDRAAFVGFGTGLVVLLGVRFGTELAWPWHPLIGDVVTASAGRIYAWRARSEAS